MKFNELLQEFKKSQFVGHLHKILIASEVECYLNKDDTHFNTVCEYLYDWYISSQISAEELATSFFVCVHNEKFNLDDFTKAVKEWDRDYLAKVDEMVENCF